MDNNKFHIAYSIENQDVAQEIDNHLSRVGIELDHIMLSHEVGEIPLQEQLNQAPHFVFILISENFLKNINCMNRSLFMIQALTQQNKYQPIIIDGRHPIEGSNAFEYSPTEFDRMTHVIKYMNFWQDHYLALRKERRQIPAEEVAAFDENLKVIRSISSEMGDFLKVLKNSNYWSQEQLTHNGYQLFFQAINKPGLHEALKEAIATGEIPKTSNPVIENTQPETTPSENISKEENITQEVEEDSLVNILLQEDEPAIEIPSIVDERIDKLSPEIKEEETNEAEAEIESDTETEPLEIPSFSSEITSVEEDRILKISEEKLKKQGKVPLLDKLIEHRKHDVQFEEHTNIGNPVTHTETKTTSPVVKEISELSPVEDDKDDVFENAISKVIEEEKNLENLENIQATESTKSNVRSHPILDEIFHDDDDELDSDEMIGNFTLSNSKDTKQEEVEIEKEQIEKEEEIKLDWKQQLIKANQLIKRGKIYAGLNLIRESVEENPNNSTLRYEYGLNLMRGADNNKDARREFEKVIQMDPLHLDAYSQLSLLAQKKGDYLLSKSYLEKALEVDDKNSDLFYQLGILTTTKFPDLQDQAADYFKRSIKIDDSNPDAHYRYGLILDEHLKKPKKAMRQFEITQEIKTDHPFVSYDLALMHYRFGEFKKAAMYYQKACTINPELKTETNDRAFLGAIDSKETTKTTKSKNFFKNLSKPTKKKKKKKRVIDSTTTMEEPNTQRNENFEKVVLISGATSGIGKATATIFARNGYRLILTGRRADRLAEIKNNFEENYPTEVQTLEFDVRKIDDAQAAIASLPIEWNSIDMLINNAGLAKGFEPIHEGKLEDWETMIDTNVKGLLYMTRLISPGMVARRKGHIINVCSTAGHEVYPNGNVYCATKHAVDALTKSMRLDFYKHGMRVSQVSPAHVEETEFARVRFDWDTERAKIYEDFQPLRAEDVANTIYFIATQPAHVNIQDVLMMGRQQANSSNLDRSGR